MLVLRGERFDFDYTPVKLSLLQHQINQKDGFYYNYPPPQSLSPTSFRVKDTASVSPPPPSETPSSGNRISPAVLFVIVILAVLFFISGILHLLVRFLTKNSHPSSSPTDHRQPSSDSRFPDFSSPDALQRQLQQLFHLHDSGLDQAFIDALPVFLYKEIVGPTKEPFDCAVCLCEFTEKDKLRLLPMCSHAFHINCIDTWLLSNSTCPLCRGTLFAAGFSMENPIFEYDEWRGDIDAGGGGGGCGGRAAVREGEMGFVSGQKAFEIEENGDDNNGEKKGVGVFPVRLGKFRKQNDGFVEEAKEGETSNVTSKNLDDRRCYSMGSYQYVVGDTDLRVTLCPEKNHGSSSRHVKFAKDVENNGNPSPGEEYREGKKITNMPRRDSYSVSKIWLWKKKGKYGSSSSNDAPIPMDNIANSLNMELPWMDKAANV